MLFSSFVHQGNNYLLKYQSNLQSLWVYQLSSEEITNPVLIASNLSHWTHLVCYSLPDGPRVLFYNENTGVIIAETILPDQRGTEEWRKTIESGWKQIVPMEMGDKTFLFFYVTGDFFKFEVTSGGLTTNNCLEHYPNYDPEWRIITPVKLGSVLYCLFYKVGVDQTTYTGFYQYTGSGWAHEQWNNHTFDTDWNQIVGFRESGKGFLIFSKKGKEPLYIYQVNASGIHGGRVLPVVRSVPAMAYFRNPTTNKHYQLSVLGKSMTIRKVREGQVLEPPKHINTQEITQVAPILLAEGRQVAVIYNKFTGYLASFHLDENGWSNPQWGLAAEKGFDIVMAYWLSGVPHFLMYKQGKEDSGNKSLTRAYQYIAQANGPDNLSLIWESERLDPAWSQIAYVNINGLDYFHFYKASTREGFLFPASVNGGFGQQVWQMANYDQDYTQIIAFSPAGDANQLVFVKRDSQRTMLFDVLDGGDKLRFRHDLKAGKAQLHIAPYQESYFNEAPLQGYYLHQGIRYYLTCEAEQLTTSQEISHALFAHPKSIKVSFGQPWTHMEILHYPSRQGVFFYNRDTGYAEEYAIDHQRISLVASLQLSGGWDQLTSYQREGQCHLLFYRQSDGLVYTAILAFGQLKHVWSSGWDRDWQQVTTFHASQQAYLFLYRDYSGYIFPLTAEGLGVNTWQNHTFSSWDQIHNWPDPEGDQIVFHQSKGQAAWRYEISSLGLGPSIGNPKAHRNQLFFLKGQKGNVTHMKGNRLMDEQQLPGSFDDFTHVVPFYRGAESCLLFMKANEGNAFGYKIFNGQLVRIDFDMIGLSPGWTAISSYHLQGRTYFLFYRTSDGLHYLSEAAPHGLGNKVWSGVLEYTPDATSKPSQGLTMDIMGNTPAMEQTPSNTEVKTYRIWKQLTTYVYQGKAYMIGYDQFDMAHYYEITGASGLVESGQQAYSPGWSHMVGYEENQVAKVLYLNETNGLFITGEVTEKLITHFKPIN